MSLKFCFAHFHVSAMNILAAGHAVLAGGEMMHDGRSMKQEPAKATA